MLLAAARVANGPKGRPGVARLVDRGPSVDSAVPTEGQLGQHAIQATSRRTVALPSIGGPNPQEKLASPLEFFG
jgi:hypothetical protein